MILEMTESSEVRAIASSMEDVPEEQALEPAHNRLQEGANDAFSFWGLDENWRAALESEIRDSSRLAEYFLFEEYLPQSRRQPPEILRTYYRFKKAIPRPLRHHLNSLAVRVRRPSFPAWPRETALLDL